MYPQLNISNRYKTKSKDGKRGRATWLALPTLALLTACGNPPVMKETGSRLDQGQAAAQRVVPQIPTDAEGLRGTQADAQTRALRQQNLPVLKRTAKSWIGSSLVPVNAEDRLPTLF